MRREGHFRQMAYFYTDEEGQPLWHDVYEYAMLEGEFNARFLSNDGCG